MEVIKILVKNARKYHASDEEIIEQLMTELSVDKAKAKGYLKKAEQSIIKKYNIEQKISRYGVPQRLLIREDGCMCEALRIRILVIACQDIRMLKYEYIKQDTDLF